MAQPARADDGDRRRLAPFLHGRRDRVPHAEAPSWRRLVRRVAGVLEHGQDRPRLVGEQALDDEGDAVRQSLLVRRCFPHVAELAALSRRVATRHASAVRLLDVAQMGNVELVLGQVLDQEAAEATRHRDVHRDVAVPAHDGLGHLGVPRARWGPAWDERRAVAPVHGERRHVVLEEPLVLVVGDDDGDVRVRAPQRLRQFVDRSLAVVGLGAKGRWPLIFPSQLRGGRRQRFLIRHHHAVRRVGQLRVVLVTFGKHRP